jgi:hypothetical protein
MKMAVGQSCGRCAAAWPSALRTGARHRTQPRPRRAHRAGRRRPPGDVSDRGRRALPRTRKMRPYRRGRWCAWVHLNGLPGPAGAVKTPRTAAGQIRAEIREIPRIPPHKQRWAAPRGNVGFVVRPILLCRHLVRVRRTSPGVLCGAMWRIRSGPACVPRRPGGVAVR